MPNLYTVTETYKGEAVATTLPKEQAQTLYDKIIAKGGVAEIREIG